MEGFDKALLSEASYADLSNLTNEQLYIDALIAEDFSQAQATAFVQTWRVVDHQPNTFTGFSATLFENIATGEKTLAPFGALMVLLMY